MKEKKEKERKKERKKEREQRMRWKGLECGKRGYIQGGIRKRPQIHDHGFLSHPAPTYLYFPSDLSSTTTGASCARIGNSKNLNLAVLLALLPWSSHSR